MAGSILVSIDAEGLPFVSSRHHMMPGDKLWGELREIMTRVASLVAEEVIQAGYRPIIADSHGSMVNVDPLRLPRGTRLIRGFPRPASMIPLTEDVAAAFFIGYHSAPGAGGVLAHTYSGRIVHRVEVHNCSNADEFLLNAYALGEEGIPVALVAGDSALEEHVKSFTPWSVFVPLKKPVSFFSDVTESIDEVLEKLGEGVRAALANVRNGEVSPLRPEEPWIRVEFNRPYHAEVALMFPCVKKLGGLTVELTCESFRRNYTLFEGLVLAAYSVERL